IGNQEVFDFTAAIVEDQRTPFLVLSLTCIGIFIKVRTVKVAEGSTVLGEMRRYPVQEDTDTLLVHIIHEILKVFGGTEATGRCIVASNLVAPGAIIRILGYGQDFNMRKAQIFDIGSQG